MLKHTLRSGAIIAAVTTALLACGKKDDTATTTTIDTTAAMTPASVVEVSDVDLGRAVGTDKKITDKTDTFKPTDQIFASVHTHGSAPTAKIAAKWMYENGTPVSENSETITPSGDAYTNFHIAKASPWPTGKYTLHVLLDDREVKTVDFTIKK